jgi:hypothetical protein
MTDKNRANKSEEKQKVKPKAPSRGASRNRKFLVDRLKAMYGKDFDPIMLAAKNALRMEEIADAAGDDEFNCRKECVAAWDKIAKYVQPALKAVEIIDEDGNNAMPKSIVINVVKP